MSMKNIIKCHLCDKEIGRNGISHHLKIIHTVKFEDYANKYPNEFPSRKQHPCKICGTSINLRNKFCSTKCTTEWRKTLVGEKSKRFGIPCNESTKIKIGENAKKRLSNPENHWATGTHLSKKTKKKISKTRKKRKLGIGKKNGMYGKTHTPEAIEKIFKHKPMNKLEKQVANWLDNHGFKYTFQFFINNNGICKSYDFKLTDTDVILEVHGDYWHGGIGVKKHHFDVENTKKNDKLKKFMAKERGYKVITIWEHEIKKDIKILESRIYNKIKKL